MTKPNNVRITRPWRSSVSFYRAQKVAELSLRNLPIDPSAQDEMELRRSAARKTAWDNRFKRSA